MQPKPNRTERLQIILNLHELAAIEDFRFKHRMPSRAAAVREVLRRGLLASDVGQALERRRSQESVVLSKGPFRDRKRGDRFPQEPKKSR